MSKPIRKTQYDIPRFSTKSSLLIMGIAILFAVIIPWLFSLIGIQNFWISAVLPAFMVALVSAYTVNFVDGDHGLGKRFYLVFGSIFIGLAVLMYFWTQGIN